VDLATCGDHVVGRTAPPAARRVFSSPDGRFVARLRGTRSASIDADGVRLDIVAARRTHRVATILAYPDSLTWCGSALVVAAGGDRLATHDKRLILLTAPDWRPRPLWTAHGRAFGSVACAPDSRSVVVQSQAQSGDASFLATRWSLWRVGLDGRPHR